MIALIPARGGSKGLPDKNIKRLADKPLIAHTIEAANSAESVSDIIVSTDSDTIADIAKYFGASIPFKRPDRLARDKSKAIDVYLYTMERLNTELNFSEDEFVVLQPTSPLREAEDIDNAICIFQNKMADSVISVTEASHPPEWAKKIKAGVSW